VRTVLPHPRANRKFVLDSPWEQLFPPHPAVEQAKLPLNRPKPRPGATS